MRGLFTSDQIKKIIELYVNGKHQHEIANIFNCSQVLISNVLRKNKIKTRKGGRLIYADVNIDFFQEINTEEKAYFLGFLYADGCVRNNNDAYTMTLKLKQGDQLILEKFRDIMSPSSPIKLTKPDKKNRQYSYFRIHQKAVITQLINLGCMPKKSLILEFPTKVPDNLIHHFMRGYSDGDGSIYNNKVKHGINTIWNICSTFQFCEKVVQLLKEKLDINCRAKICDEEKNMITSSLSVGGNNQTEKVLDWLYKDATIYLQRKYDKYFAFKEIKLSQRYVVFKKLNLTLEQKENIIKLYNDGYSSIEIFEYYKISKPSVLKILRDGGVIMRSGRYRSPKLVK